MPIETEWGRLVGVALEDLGQRRSAESRNVAEPWAELRLPQVSRPTTATDAVFIGCRYASYPVLGELAWDVEQFDLAVRRAALATEKGFLVERFLRSDVRVPRRLGLQMRGSTQGSLEILLDIPAWIVAALASQPATAVANLITLLGARESIRVRIRGILLTAEEKRILEASSRPPAQLPTTSGGGVVAPGIRELLEADQPDTRSGKQSTHTNARQGTLPRRIKERLDSTEADVEVDVGNVVVRTQGLAVEISVQEGDRLTSISAVPKTQT